MIVANTEKKEANFITAPNFTYLGRNKHSVLFAAPGWQAQIFILGEQLWKVLLYPEGQVLPPSLSVAWQQTDCDPNPHNRLQPQGFPFADFSVFQQDESTVISSRQMKVEVRHHGLQLSWYLQDANGWSPLFRDRTTQSYNFNGMLGQGSFHYVERKRDDLHFGLGERAGHVVKTHGRYRMKNIDCMGYDAEFSDPLYKHIPYYLCKSAGGFYALYYDIPADCTIDLGRELDNYHGLYQYFHAESPFLDYYVMGGAALHEIVPTFARLGGQPCFPPLWSLGYLASSMGYADAENAQEMLEVFLQRCRQEQIPCSGFHLSSGYTRIGDKRYVFHWDKGRFPNPSALFQQYREAGVRMIANIKPCLLLDHPLYAECEQLGLFVTGTDGKPLKTQFWDALGSYLDFSNPETSRWWQIKVRETLLAMGIASTWNDNNEFEIWDKNAHCHGYIGQQAAGSIKPTFTLEMLRSSRFAQQQECPSHRPFLISRAGCHGMQRYVQTWSGDNYTQWKTLRFNHKMGLGMSLSGLYNFGHDVGGFAGAKPEPELFLRWVQHGIFMPRFSIHSWNDDGTVNEPWMYPAHTAAVKRLIDLRYQLLPHLYTLLYQSHTEYKPIIAPVFYHYPAETDYESDLYLLGETLLVANVFDQGINQLQLNLPAGRAWYSLWDKTHYPAASKVTVLAPAEGPVPVFCAEGSVVMLDTAAGGFGQKQAEILFLVFAPESGSCTQHFFVDDGETYAYQKGACNKPCFTISANNNSLTVRLCNEGSHPFSSPIRLQVIDNLHRPVSVQCADYEFTFCTEDFSW